MPVYVLVDSVLTPMTPKERDEYLEQQKQDRIFNATAKNIRGIKRRKKLQEREERKLGKEQNDGQVYQALSNGKTTTNQIAKATGLEARLVRQALKRLAKAEKVHQVSARVWSAAPRKRRRLRDIQQ